jgi:hypothetical protein
VSVGLNRAALGLRALQIIRDDEFDDLVERAERALADAKNRSATAAIKHPEVRS